MVTPTRLLGKDDRHKVAANYWKFLEDAWNGCAPLLHRKATIVVRIGGRKQSVSELADGLLNSLRRGLQMSVNLLGAPITTDIKRGQINSFRPGSNQHEKKEHDFVFRLS